LAEDLLAELARRPRVALGVGAAVEAGPAEELGQPRGRGRLEDDIPRAGLDLAGVRRCLRLLDRARDELVDGDRADPRRGGLGPPRAVLALDRDPERGARAVEEAEETLRIHVGERALGARRRDVARGLEAGLRRLVDRVLGERGALLGRERVG